MPRKLNPNLDALKTQDRRPQQKLKKYPQKFRRVLNSSRLRGSIWFLKKKIQDKNIYIRKKKRKRYIQEPQNEC